MSNYFHCACLICASVLLISGCKHATVEVDAVHRPSISSVTDIEPTTPPNPRGMLTLEGTSFDVDIATSLKGSSFQIDVSHEKEHFDHEQYESTAGGFSLVKAAGEVCEPPIPLLKFPMTIGDTWDWSGNTKADSDELPASAIISSEQKQVFQGSVPIDAVIITVNLTIQSHKPIQRELKFYFSKGRGLFKRQFGDNSERSPRTDQ